MRKYVVVGAQEKLSDANGYFALGINPSTSFLRHVRPKLDRQRKSAYLELVSFT